MTQGLGGVFYQPSKSYGWFISSEDNWGVKVSDFHEMILYGPIVIKILENLDISSYIFSKSSSGCSIIIGLKTFHYIFVDPIFWLGIFVLKRCPLVIEQEQVWCSCDFVEMLEFPPDILCWILGLLQVLKDLVERLVSCYLLENPDNSWKGRDLTPGHFKGTHYLELGATGVWTFHSTRKILCTSS